MIPAEILKQVRRIEIYTNRIVNETLAGRYQSVFKGQGIEFEEVREYQPGDEIRSIDWNVTARTGRPHIKRFIEERELSVVFAVDLSRSMAFGSVGQYKQRLAAELCAVLAFSAIRNHDRVGLSLFSDQVERFVPPGKGLRHVLRVIREVLSFESTGVQTNIPSALEHLHRVLHRKSVIFLVSDFLNEDFSRSLSLVNKHHDVIAVQILDPREENLPDAGWIRLRDAETQQSMLVDTQRAQARKAYAQLTQTRQATLKRMLQRVGVDRIVVRQGESYVEPLIRFFAMRALRR